MVNIKYKMDVKFLTNLEFLTVYLKKFCWLWTNYKSKKLSMLRKPVNVSCTPQFDYYSLWHSLAQNKRKIIVCNIPFFSLPFGATLDNFQFGHLGQRWVMLKPRHDHMLILAVWQGAPSCQISKLLGVRFALNWMSYIL